MYAQQIPVYNLYTINPYLVNPSAAGHQEELQGHALYRRQWAQVPGAPQTQLLTVAGRTSNKRVGLGMQVYNDINNIIGTTGALFTYAYHLPIDGSQKIAFGLSAGFRQTRVHFDRVVGKVVYDDALLRQADRNTSFDGDFGVTYHNRKLQIGLATQQLFANRVLFSDETDFKSLSYKLIRHFSGTARYTIPVPSQMLTVEPVVAFRTAQGLPFQFDISTVLRYRKDFWLAPGYRTGSGFTMATGTRVAEHFHFGYAFELNTGNLATFGGGTHEFTLGVRLSGKRKSSVSGGAKAGVTNQQITRQLAEQYEMMDQLSEQNQRLTEEVQRSHERIDRQQQEIERLRQVTQQDDSQDLKALKQQLDQLAAEENFEPNRYDFYVVVSAFKKLENAKSQQKIFQREANLATQLIFNQKTGYYLIYTEGVETIQEGLDKAQKLQQSNVQPWLVGSPWIYVHDHR